MTSSYTSHRHHHNALRDLGLMACSDLIFTNPVVFSVDVPGFFPLMVGSSGQHKSKQNCTNYRLVYDLFVWKRLNKCILAVLKMRQFLNNIHQQKHFVQHSTPHLFWYSGYGGQTDVSLDCGCFYGSIVRPQMSMSEGVNKWKNYFFNFRKRGANGGMILTGENRRTLRKTCLSATLSTTNPTGLTGVRTQAVAVTGRRLTAWAMERPHHFGYKHKE
jgi:hypothetical protein